MQYHSAETHDHSEQDYDIESNQGRTQEENSDTSKAVIYTGKVFFSGLIAYALYDGISRAIKYLLTL